MNTVQKIVGYIYPPYRSSLFRKENNLLISSIISSLPESYKVLKDELKETKVLYFSDWELMPGYKFITKSYSENFLKDYKRRGVNYKLTELSIYSNRNNKFENLELIIWDNLLSGILIHNSIYSLGEFDLKQIKVEKLKETTITFAPTDFDIFINSIDQRIKEKLDFESIFDIDYNNKTYYAFYDLEDGNYLAMDKSLNVYSLVHDAKPASKRMKLSLEEILDKINAGHFDKDQHLEERHKNGS